MTIVGPTAVGAGSYIERDVVIRQAAIWSSCRIGAGAIVDDSIVVDGATVEPGTVMRDAIWTDGMSDCLQRGGRLDSYWALASAEGRQIYPEGAGIHR